MGMIEGNYSEPAMQLEDMAQQEATNACSEQQPASKDAEEVDE